MGPSGASSGVGGLVHTLGPCGSLQRLLLWGWESLLLPPQPPQALPIRGLRLYFHALEPWVRRSASLPTVRPGLSVRECGAAGYYPPLCLPRSPPLWVGPSRFICPNVGPQGLLVVRLPAPFFPISTSLGPATATRVLSAQAACLRPSYRLDECWFFISLVSGFLAVWFSVSSGCARRHSVST